MPVAYTPSPPTDTLPEDPSYFGWFDLFPAGGLWHLWDGIDLFGPDVPPPPVAPTSIAPPPPVAPTSIAPPPPAASTSMVTPAPVAIPVADPTPTSAFSPILGVWDDSPAILPDLPSTIVPPTATATGISKSVPIPIPTASPTLESASMISPSRVLLPKVGALGTKAIPTVRSPPSPGQGVVKKTNPPPRPPPRPSPPPPRRPPPPTSKGVITPSISLAGLRDISLPGNAGTYAKPLMMSILFFEAQRSGSLPSTQRLPWRKAAHLRDGSDLRVDLSGGYYDAGDFVKFGLPGSFTNTMLAWTALDYAGGVQSAGQTSHLHTAIRWGTDYLLKCHLGPERFVIQVGDPKPDHDYWGSPEDMPSSTPRPIFLATRNWRASEPLAESAAALASASIVLGPNDSAYATRLLRSARALFAQAERYPGLYQQGLAKQLRGGMQGVKDCYESSGYADELAWAAMWLYRATKEPAYLAKARTFVDRMNLETRHGFLNWDDKAIGALALLAGITKEPKYVALLREHADWISTKAKRTPGGLLWLTASDWGSSSVALSASFIVGYAYDHLPSPRPEWDRFSRSQVDYLLGKNPAKRNYVVGADLSSPLRTHHAAAQGVQPPGKGWDLYESATPNRFVLWGAIVGGPGRRDDFRDARGDFKGNEPALDYNAVFVASLGRLANKA